MNTNLKSYGHILKQEGTSRYERYARALQPDKVLIDDRKMQDFIVYAQRYSRNLLFIDTETNDVDLQNDNWEYFFRQDIVLLIANIATRNVAEIKAVYDVISSRFERERSPDNFMELVDYVFSRYQKVSSWYYSAAEGSSLETDLTLYIRSYLKKELESLKEIILYVKNQGKSTYTGDDFKKDLFNVQEVAGANKLIGWDNIWDLKDRRGSGSRENIFAGENEEEKLISASLRLNQIFDAVFHVTETITHACNSYFDDTISKNQEHPPHVAFLIAFIKLYGHVQDALNKIPQKHLDFYYKEVLRIKEKEAIPDQVFVVFDLAKGFDTAVIKKNTALSAGKDKRNVERLYKTTREIVVNKAAVASLNTIYIDKEAGKTINYYTDVISGEKAADGSSWKIFGGAKKGTIAEIGFAIASTQFYLAKGQRDVVITFGLQDDITREPFDLSIIRLLLTGEKGWLSSDDPESRIDITSLKRTGDRRIELHFSISIAQPLAIIACDAKLHPGGFTTAMPVLQCILKYPEPPAGDSEEERTQWNGRIAQLNILQRLRIIHTSIRVQVGSIDASFSFDGLRDLVLENHEAVLDSKKPFYPFTPLPRVGSSFYIGCKDFYYKPIQKLAVNVEWMLPDNFHSYYKNYLPPYDSNKFRASLSILIDKHWKKIDDISIIDADSKNPKYRSIKLGFGEAVLDEIPGKPEPGVAAFDSSKSDRTLRLTLNYPDFGHDIYPQLITSAVMEKASSKSSSVDFYKIVKRELRDSAISIKLPEDLEVRTGPLKVVVYDILERVANDAQARNMIINGLSELIRRSNGSNTVIRKNKAGQVVEEQEAEGDEQIIVNDDNIIERFLGLLKKVKLISKDIHYDEDKETTDDVVDEVKEKINSRADFIMPSDRELVSIITNETNNAINTTVANVVDDILELRKSPSGITDPRVVADLLKKEFDEANDVINDMIARKIAILLSTNEVPPPPYSPLINNISVSYSSMKSSDKGGDEFFYITPFGVSQIDLLNNAKRIDLKSENQEWGTSNYIFPRSIVSDLDDKGEMQGMLFVGIKELAHDQNLSLLFQLAEGSKNNDKKPPTVIWWYLRDKEWIRLKKDYLLSDSSYGLQTTGILEFSIPADANNKGILFGQDSLFWLCASVAAEADAFPALTDVKAQAATAVFHDQGNDPLDLALPLEAGVVKTMSEPMPAIKKISQPVSSFNGKVKEHEQEFYTRVSERLRHKGRAINNWDYERLVLEQFPYLYKVKCLNNYFQGQFLTGHVTVVPISNQTNKNYSGNNILIPKINYLDLRSIEKFLAARSSPFVRIHAVNPQLNHVHISCSVKFRTGVDKGYYLQKLNQDLINFLTPWSTGEMEALTFSAKIYASSIVNFIDKRDYVDYVTQLVMRQYTEEENGEKVFSTDADQLTSLVETVFTTGHAILVSAPEHDIQLIE